MGGVQPLRRIFFDCEFLEEGAWKPVELASIGMVDESGRTLYAVVDDAVRDWGHGGTDLYTRLRADPWHRVNTVPHLDAAPRHMVLDRATIADDVLSFIRGGLPADTRRERIQLWSWFGAYDHVVLAQLFGRMVDLPSAVPMYTCDLQQECDRLGFDPASVPRDGDSEHNALADAFWHRELFRALARYIDQLGG